MPVAAPEAVAAAHLAARRGSGEGSERELPDRRAAAADGDRATASNGLDAGRPASFLDDHGGSMLAAWFDAPEEEERTFLRRSERPGLVLDKALYHARRAAA